MTGGPRLLLTLEPPRDRATAEPPRPRMTRSPLPATEQFPAAMTAECIEGHRWRLAITWWPTHLRAAGTWDPDVPAPLPRYCARCAKAGRHFVPAAAFHGLDEAPAAPAGEGQSREERTGGHVTPTRYVDRAGPSAEG